MERESKHQNQFRLKSSQHQLDLKARVLALHRYNHEPEEDIHGQAPESRMFKPCHNRKKE